MKHRFATTMPASKNNIKKMILADASGVTMHVSGASVTPTSLFTTRLSTQH